MNPLIELHDLLVMRGKHAALTLEHLAIQEREALAIIGPNGAGKSTLLLTLARLLKPKRGEIRFDGKRASEESDLAYRRRIALVMQDPLLFDTTVFDNVAAGLRFRGVSREEIQRKVPLWLERLGVAHLIKRRARKLSGGEAQRVSLARAMILEPRLLLLDEPFSALDPPTHSRLLEDMGTLLTETGTTTVFVTHNLREVTQFASRMAVVAGGKMLQVGTPDSVFASPVDEDVAQFLRHIPTNNL